MKIFSSRIPLTGNMKITARSSPSTKAPKYLREASGVDIPSNSHANVVNVVSGQLFFNSRERMAKIEDDT